MSSTPSIGIPGGGGGPGGGGCRAGSAAKATWILKNVTKIVIILFIIVLNGDKSITYIAL